jgi:hypothetical protein
MLNNASGCQQKNLLFWVLGAYILNLNSAENLVENLGMPFLTHCFLDSR